MKITLRPKGATDNSSDVVLADGADRAADNVRGPARAEISVSIAVQPFQGIRAPAARFFSRANRAGSYSFIASRRFASQEAAGRFVLLHGSECPAEGTLIFDVGDAEATPPGKLVLLHGAAIRQIGPMQRVGVSISTSYSCQYSLAAEATADELQAAIEEFADLTLRHRINCGADAAVGTWMPDTYGYGGATNYHAADAAVENAGAVPLDVYRRYVACSYSPTNKIQYSIPLSAGDYDVALHFCAFSGAISYVQNIAFAGSNVRSGFDVSAEAGGVLKALVETITASGHAGGNFVITCTPSGSGKYAVLCGIEITPK